MRISDWSSDVCSSDLLLIFVERIEQRIIAVARLLFDLMKRRLPSRPVGRRPIVTRAREQVFAIKLQPRVDIPGDAPGLARDAVGVDHRSEEHTSELQSLMRISYDVFCLKKKITVH